MNICTIADKNYLTKALAMYHSLCENLDVFTLYFLAIDTETYNKLNQLSLPNIQIYYLEDLENNDSVLLDAKSNPPSKYGNQYSQYCWTLTPYFTNYILKNFIKEDEYLMYVDADIYFYGSPKIILETIGIRPIGIHTHRFSLPFKETLSGWFNCGIVVFKNDEYGCYASDLWKLWLLNPENKHYEKYGTCGDQKYLELINREFYTCVFDENILHGAPWCCNDLNGKEILWYHFSHFTVNGDTWCDHINNPPEWRPSGYTFIKPYYENYFSVIKEMEKKCLV